MDTHPQGEFILPSHEEPAGSWTTFTFGWLILSTLVATGVMVLRVGRGFVIVTDNAAFPRGNMTLSFYLAFYCPWSALHTPETCRSRFDCDRCAFYRVGLRFTWTTDDFPAENRHILSAVFLTRVCLWPPALYQSSGKDDTRWDDSSDQNFRERGLVSLDSSACLVLWWSRRATDVRKHTTCDTQECNLTV